MRPWAFLAVAMAVLLSGCTTCGPGWSFSWQDEGWASAPEGWRVEPAGGVAVTVPGVDTNTTWTHVERLEERGRVRVVPGFAGQWRVKVEGIDDALARDAAVDLLADVVGERAGGIAASMVLVTVACPEGENCPRGPGTWQADFAGPVTLPGTWFDQGALEPVSPGTARWVTGTTSVWLGVPTYHLATQSGGQDVYVRGDALGSVVADVFVTVQQDPISRGEALAALRAVLPAGRDVPADARATQDSCFV